MTLSVVIANSPHEKGILQAFLKCNDQNLRERAQQLLYQFKRSSSIEDELESSEIYRTKSNDSFSIERLSLDQRQDDTDSTKDTISKKTTKQSRLHSSTGALSNKMYA